MPFTVWPGTGGIYKWVSADTLGSTRRDGPPSSPTPAAATGSSLSFQHVAMPCRLVHDAERAVRTAEQRLRVAERLAFQL